MPEASFFKTQVGKERIEKTFRFIGDEMALNQLNNGIQTYSSISSFRKVKGIEVARSSAIFASFESGIEKMQNHRIQGARMRLPNVIQIKAFASKDSLNGLKYSVQG